MLFEYAIAPATLFEAAKKRQNYRSFMKEFQIGNPKVISEFPRFKQYKKLVKHQFPQCSNDNHESRLTELLMFIKSSLKVQRCAEYNGLQTWEDNAFDDHLRDGPITASKADWLAGTTWPGFSTKTVPLFDCYMRNS